jgi:membrane protein
MAHAWRTARSLARRSLAEFFDDGCPQRAAAISYYGLLSLFPLVILAVGALGLLLDSASARDNVIDFVLDRAPLRPDAGRRDLHDLLTGVADHASGFGAFGAAGLVLAASGIMGAIRHGLNAAWDVEDPRPPLQGKLIDLLLVLGFGLATAASFALSLLVRFSAAFAGDIGRRLGSDVPATAVAWTGRLVPLAISLAIFALLFRLVPARPTRLRETWPGVLVAVAGFEAAKAGFSFYLNHAARYDAIYASLGGIVAFLVFIWIAANVLLLGAEVASEYPRLRAAPDRPAGDGRPLRARLIGALRGLVVRRDRSLPPGAGSGAGRAAARREHPGDQPQAQRRDDECDQDHDDDRKDHAG